MPKSIKITFECNPEEAQFLTALHVALSGNETDAVRYRLLPEALIALQDNLRYKAVAGSGDVPPEDLDNESSFFADAGWTIDEVYFIEDFLTLDSVSDQDDTADFDFVGDYNEIEASGPPFPQNPPLLYISANDQGLFFTHPN